MRRFVMLAIAILVILIGYAIKTTVFTSLTAASLLAVATPAATLSPHEIHLNYKGMKDLPVHDSTNAN
jgi:50S ribosomal subunit-associated GTPase HflX